MVYKVDITILHWVYKATNITGGAAPCTMDDGTGVALCRKSPTGGVSPFYETESSIWDEHIHWIVFFFFKLQDTLIYFMDI